MTGPRRKIAYFSPLNPNRSGVSDHSEELLPLLAAFADIDIVVDQTEAPTAVSILEKFSIITPQAFLDAAETYDLAIYQLGNNYYQHGYMVDCMRQVPGIIALQDYCLQYVMLPLTLGRGRFGELEEVLRVDYGDSARRLARQLLFGRIDPNSLSFAGPLLRECRAVAVHSHYLADEIRQKHPDTFVRYVTLGFPFATQHTDPDRRSRYEFDEDDFIVASLSTLVPKKRLMVLLRVIRRLSLQWPRLRLLVVGGGTLGDEASDYIRSTGLQSIVRLTGWVEEAAYRDYAALSDVVIDIRETSAGETASSLLRAFGLGKPAIVTGAGVFSELPDEVCIKIDVENNAEEHLAAAIEQLHEDREQLQIMGAAARQYAEANLRVEQTAADYAKLIEDVIEQTPKRVRSPSLMADRSRWRAAAVRSAYYVFRIGFLYKNYGLKGALARVRREFSRAITPLAARVNPAKIR